MICPDLKTGLVFSNSNNKGEKFIEAEIISFDEKTLTVKVLFCENEYFSRYLDVGKTYTGTLVNNWDDMKVWDINPKQMKRSVSQVLIQWQSASGFGWDLDS